MNYGPPAFDNTIKAFDLAHCLGVEPSCQTIHILDQVILTASTNLDQPDAGPSSLKCPHLEERISMDVKEDTISLGDDVMDWFSFFLSYLHILSTSNLSLVLCTLPPLISCSLAPSSTMMSCTVHSPTDSLVQPSCTLVYIECNPAPRGSSFKLSLGLCSKILSPILSPPSQSLCVLVLGPLALGFLR